MTIIIPLAFLLELFLDVQCQPVFQSFQLILSVVVNISVCVLARNAHNSLIDHTLYLHTLYIIECMYVMYTH